MNRLSRTRNEHLAASLVEILHPDGRRRIGTGALVDAAGTVVTCDHNVADLDEVKVVRHGSRGKTRECCRVAVTAAARNEHWDLALLETGWETGQDALPIAEAKPQGRWFTLGFQDYELGFEAPVPLRGEFDLTPAFHAAPRKYPAAGLRYSPPATIDLGGRPIAGGTSGAPLLDADDEAVIGVVVSSLIDDKNPFALSGRALAVPLHQAARDWPRLAALVERNRREVLCFGEQPNALAAQMLCRAVAQAAAQRTVGPYRPFDSAVYVERSGLTAPLAAFLASGATLMPVVGPTGTGKSWLLADLATRPNAPPTLLLLGRAIPPAAPSVSAPAEDALKALATPRAPEEAPTIPRDLPLPSIDALARGVREAGLPLLIVVDGLNEAPIPETQLHDAWLPDSIAWAKASGARIVLSCHPETWRRLRGAVPADIWPPQGQGEPGTVRKEGHLSGVAERGGVVSVGNFTRQEYRAALRSYGLQEGLAPDDGADPFLGGLAPDDAAYPFLVGLAASRRDDGKRRSLVELIEQHLESRVQKALRVLPIQLRSELVGRGVLRDVALRMAEAGRSYLEAAEVRGMPELAEWLPALSATFILEERSDGVRFAMDPIADYEQAKLLDLTRAPEELRADAARFRAPAPAWGVCWFVLERLWRKAGVDGVLSLKFYLGRPSPAEIYRSRSQAFLDYALPRIEAAPLPPGICCALLIEAGRLTDSNDWPDPTGLAPWWTWGGAQKAFGGSMLRVADRHPAEMRAALVGHLADERSIVGVLADKTPGIVRHGKPSMADLASGCLYRLAVDRDFDSVIADLMTTPLVADTSYSLVRHLCVSRPDRAAAAAADALETSQRRSVWMTNTLTALQYSRADALDEKLRARIAGLLQTRLAEATSDDERIPIAHLLPGFDPDDRSGWDTLFAIWGTARNPRSGERRHRVAYSSLWHVPRERLGTLLDRLDREIVLRDPLALRPAAVDLQEDAIRIVTSPKVAFTEPERALAFLGRFAGHSHGLDERIADGVVDALYAAGDDDQETFVAGALGLIERIAAANPGRCPKPFIRFVCGLPKQPHLRSRVLDALSKSPVGLEALDLAFEALDPHCLRSPLGVGVAEAMEFLLPLRAASRPDWDDRAALRAYAGMESGGERDTASALVDTWRRLPESERSPLAREVLLRLAAGNGMKEALELGLTRGL
jgi:hypothetical protein